MKVFSHKRQQGLTLIEVLIALAVLSIALTAIVRATAMDIRDTSYLRDKTVALWVANDSMTQVQLDIVKVSSSHLEMTSNMLGQEWHWRAELTPTPNHYVDKLTISVSKKSGGPPLVVLSGFKEVT